MKKEGMWAKISGDDVEDVLLVRFLEDNVIEIDSFRGREKHYKIEISKIGMRGDLRRIGHGGRFQFYRLEN